MIFYVFLTVHVIAQNNTIDLISRKILQEFNLTRYTDYNSLEELLLNYEPPINLQVFKYKNIFDAEKIDYYYLLLFENCRLSFRKSALADKYHINDIQIFLEEGDIFYSLLPYNRIEQFRQDLFFGKILDDYLDDDGEHLIYEVVAGLEYVTLSFVDGGIKELTIVYSQE